MNWLAAVSKRLWFGPNPELRKSRIHTQKGQYALGSLGGAADCIAALATGVGRKTAGIRPVPHWITFPAIPFASPADQNPTCWSIPRQYPKPIDDSCT